MFECLSLLQVHRVTIEASHSRYLRCPGRVFNLYPSFVLDLNHSDQWNTLLSAEGEIFQLTNMATLLGNRYMYQLFWSSLVLQLLSESMLLLQLSSVISAIWLSQFGFETSKSVQIWIISTFYALFLYSIYQPLPWSGLFLTWSIILFVFCIFTKNRTCYVGKEWCYHLSIVSNTRCHHLNLVSKERFYLKTVCQQLHLRGAR